MKPTKQKVLSGIRHDAVLAKMEELLATGKYQYARHFLISGGIAESSINDSFPRIEKAKTLVIILSEVSE